MAIKKELEIIIFTTTVPAIATYAIGGTKLLKEVIESLLAHEWLMYYSMFGSVLYVAFAYVNWRFIFKNQNVKASINSMAKLLQESASTFLGTLRIAGGLLVTIPILWLLFDYDQSQLDNMIYLFLFGCVATAECVVIKSSLDHIGNKWLR